MKIIECWFSERGYAIRSPIGDSNTKIAYSDEAGQYAAAWASLGLLLDHLQGASESGFPDFELRLFNDSRIVDELNESIEALLPDQISHYKKYDKPRFRRVSAYKVAAREIEHKIQEDLI